ncbi:MAG: 3-oxoacyl-[acyl-carrier-protein] reductase [Gammaproteobacteria bacterium RIFCSPLOWO2_02_FULL_47_50]|nr:MAG: 3-oxoacyl-[acyl-carrier-protein] reductase [Gammaproteobacteria bacterium RIFCSPLOWO2_02_47_7]OGT67251.1 MAG: 3-oxoacyl-[acyl-carrier-protein] reductase [Gammaproteobacteria bacterium RIFCSPLOWO2_01_FULL_47_190]OGT71634.1 MAG: 3-oxoacyl-[acyl-carrier-protein] reductase [Gammaproteobacteria bacterium RIFCSPLOWO2_12_47_11]OGT80883.1 MAG: 3-oxoacyl-[acyl-carrier-protein] reductase [Gammaproteobacteria bacterium RIFCSPLOWO2_02_FULL_47_50]OGT83408.1 MAG: 3-oxoacyl-[acyl-carrier-protein] redu
MKSDQQVALITGASRGIGKAIAKALGEAGYYVAGTATGKTGMDAIKELLSEYKIKGSAFILDVADPASVERLGEELKSADLSPTILVNNAGITRDNLLLRMKDEEWYDVINTNLNSIYRLTKLCLRGMTKARSGRIINITSVVASSGNAGQCNYSAAKAGIIGFTRSLAREVGSRGITVNAVAPGFIETDMTHGLSEVQQKALLEQIALNRFGDVNEIASVVVFLASAGACYITGETINVNGGMYMG